MIILFTVKPPLMVTSLQQPLSSVPKVAVVEIIIIIIVIVIIINFTVSIFVSNLLNVSCTTSILHVWSFYQWHWYTMI